MIVYNTTYHAHTSVNDDFLDWLRREYIPAATRDGRLTEPRLTVVLNAEADDGTNYSLQFRARSLDTLRAWYESGGDDLVVAMSQRFGHRVAGFSTLLEEMEL